jgi:hypothetical protein
LQTFFQVFLHLVINKIMQTIIRKQINFLFILLVCNLVPSCGLFKKDPTSVEQAEKLISKDRQRRKNKAIKMRKATMQSHWDRQSKSARKTIKKSERDKKIIDRIKKKNTRYRKKHFS